ncbi:hypothetical protein CFAM422_010889 [Trichoderma lentiforme]|uniref:Uncharacterized protein n=1 Tax=Trichoderma lentiforme TaxID=1567552 RepID=A0A9P4X6T0_9HYPO|nr:hypothetical protein CFAM422_010889 [Trichoderma lentiforme]
MLDSRTALHELTHWVWLPNNALLRALEDPLNLSNVDDDLLPALRGSLGNVHIRHICLSFEERRLYMEVSCSSVQELVLAIRSAENFIIAYFNCKTSHGRLR